MNEPSSIAGRSEAVPELAAIGVRAFTTMRSVGSFGLQTTDPVHEVMSRWSLLAAEMASGGSRLATVRQVHGASVTVHQSGWAGWLRAPEADGHVSMERGTALVVTIADCVPVFIAHPSGAVALLHSGWRGTAARITSHAIGLLRDRGLPPSELIMHTGPAICGQCYEVSAGVYAQLTGTNVDRPTTIDLRTLIAAEAREQGVTQVSTTASCTRCNNDRFFSHRAGDAGRQVAVMLADERAL